MTCEDCKHINKKKKSRKILGYIFCNKFRWWTDKNNLCPLVRSHLKQLTKEKL